MSFKIAVIDDEDIYRKQIVFFCNELNIQAQEFSSCFDFLYAVKNGENFEITIVDRFINRVDILEEDFLIDCFQLSYHKPIILYSNSINSASMAGFEHLLPKDSPTLKEDFRGLVEALSPKNSDTSKIISK